MHLSSGQGFPEPTPEVDVDEVVLNALFGKDTPSLDPSRVAGKHTYSSESTFYPKKSRQTKRGSGSSWRQPSDALFLIRTCGSRE
ncbi:hypothetical protein MTR67_011964 [Solanum verrucosum]|uniref:Uncharacterized protein n=1 Tax=Solanum verrucosum TaxID=315347 RepID=A0AAF0TH30_SOLVR|nr:hypothetical protein MTR67_011964 [Solanum verrucosum]